MLCGPVGLAVFSCGIRLTPLEAVTNVCSLPISQRNQALVLLSSLSSPFRKGTRLAICYYSVLSGPYVVTSIIQLLLVLPLKAITSGCCLASPLCVPSTELIHCIFAELAIYQFSLVVLKGPSFRQNAIGSKGEEGLESG